MVYCACPKRCGLFQVCVVTAASVSGTEGLHCQASQQMGDQGRASSALQRFLSVARRIENLSKQVVTRRSKTHSEERSTIRGEL